jgi:hypothetical protein
MEHPSFHAGEQLWLHGQRVVFVDYHRYAASSVRAAVVRRHDETTHRVVPVRKLARDRAESLARETAMRS